MSWKSVPGWLYDIEGNELAKQAKDKNVLEIGSWCGRSTCAMAPHARSIICVDWFRGSPDDCLGEHNSEKIFLRFLKNTNQFDNLLYNKIDFSIWKQANTPTDFNFIFYDAGHSYETCNEFLEWVKAGGYTGTLALHDYGKPDFPGTQQAVDEHKGDRPFTLTGSLICFNLE